MTIASTARRLTLIALLTAAPASAQETAPVAFPLEPAAPDPAAPAPAEPAAAVLAPSAVEPAAGPALDPLELLLGPPVGSIAPPPQGAVVDGRSITTEQVEAVTRGLAWLASRQNDDGSWTGKVGYKLNNGYRYTRETGHVGVTSLALMAFLAGGNLPGRGEYGDVVERGLDWILAVTETQGDGYATAGGTRMYSHAFATLVLAEIYGMTHREDVRSVLQRAVDFIVRAQNEEGGWRYEPFAPQSDMSIVVCQVLALRAARNIGIRVPKTTIDRAAQYIVDSAITDSDLRGGFHHRMFADEVGAFVYQKGRSSRSSFPLTSAGVTALHGVGIYSDEAIRKGLDYLRSNLGRFNDRYGVRDNGHYFFWYGHYYGVQAMYTAGTQNGVDYWHPYFVEVRDVILGLQSPDGSWPNDVGPGPEFGTAVAILVLEIPYRYLPIFQR